MDGNGSKGVFHQDIPKLEGEARSILREFDKFVSEIKGGNADESHKKLRSLLEKHSDELTEHFKILSTIFHISSLFSSHSNLNEILSHIVQSVKELLNFNRVIILLLNEKGSLLECKIMSGMSQDKIAWTQSRPLSMENHECIETKVAKFGNSYLIEDINDPRLTEIDRKIIRTFGRGTTIYVPIISKKGIIGVLGVDRKSHRPRLKLEDVYRVQLFANYIGGLIENAKLYDTIVRHKNHFENIVKQSPNGIIVADAHGNTSLVNQAAERLLDINPTQFLGLPIERMLKPELVRNVRQALSSQDRVQFFDLDYENLDGKKLILNVSALNLRYENKTEIIFIFQNITEKKMIDDHLQRLDKLASIGTMAAGIAHEIRSPLTSISMDLDSLYDSPFKMEDVRKTIVQVLNEIERIDNIVSNLLQFSRPANREFVCFELRDVIEKSISIAKKKIGEKRIQIQTEIGSSKLEITGSPDRVEQMIINLIINAIEAIRVEGTITLKAEMPKTSDFYLSKPLKESFFCSYKNIIKITIEDTGDGIPPELIERIFDPYFTTKNSGTGLGLSIVTKVVEEHQGYISVSGTPGQGSIFEIFVPATPEAE